MKISIAKKLQIFSSRPGVEYMVPGSACKVSLFPTRLYLAPLYSQLPPIDIVWGKKCEISDFRADLDLERGWVECSLRKEGIFYRVRITSCEGGGGIELIKGSDLVCESLALSQRWTLTRGERIILLKEPCIGSDLYLKEKLSLGSHKALMLEKVIARQEIEELFAIVYALAQWTPLCESEEFTPPAGSLYLIEELRVAILKKQDPRPPFLRLFQAGFPYFIPRLYDSCYLGFTDPDEVIPKNVSPLLLFNRLFPLLRSLFLQVNKQEITFLPTHYFPEGRLIGVDCHGRLDMEWSQKQIKKVIFQPIESATFSFCSHPSIRSFRLRLSKNDKGCRFSVGEKLELEAGKTYWLDRFQK